MNEITKQSNNARRRENRRAGKRLINVIGTVGRIELCQREVERTVGGETVKQLTSKHLNRNRRAVFVFDFTIEDGGKKIRVYISQALRARCQKELRDGDKLALELQKFSYSTSKDEYELLNFVQLTEQNLMPDSSEIQAAERVHDRSPAC